MSTRQPDEREDGPTRYEYRVWGRHRAARKVLRRLADSTTRETIEDCYLFVDDVAYNAKVRDNTLKIKQLIDEDKGFEQWASGRHRTAASVPSPFDDVFDLLRLDRPQRGKKYDLERAVGALRKSDGVDAVFVMKHRTRYRIGSMRAEIAEIVVRDSGHVLHSLSIEGDDVDDLKALRKQLGLRGEPNLAMHQAILDEVG
ncbi:MAG: hypothetical protein AB8G26_05395 [Ilumatobacter sp.]